MNRSIKSQELPRPFNASLLFLYCFYWIIICVAAWALLAAFIVSWKYVWKIQREDENSEKPINTLGSLTAIEINGV